MGDAASRYARDGEIFSFLLRTWDGDPETTYRWNASTTRRATARTIADGRQRKNNVGIVAMSSFTIGKVRNFRRR
jgi:hypothetical protein